MADPSGATRPSAIGGAFRRPFREQVAFFRGKLGNLVPTSRWDDITAAEHDTAFMVAGAQKADLLADLAASVDRAIAEGKSLDAFRKDFDAAVARNDWHGWTGEGTKAGRAWRTRTIYRTNATVAYAAGRRAQLEAGNFAYWVYKHGGSRDPRPEHLSWNGMALPPDHPFWVKHYPPSDWGCSCYVVGARSAAGVKRLGGRIVTDPPPGWDRVDPRTGEPAGIGKGWGYAPGARVADAVRTIAAKTSGLEHQIATAFFGSLPAPLRDQLAESYRTLPSVADDARRFAVAVLRDVDMPDGRRRTIGPVTSDEAAKLSPLLGASPDAFDWSIAPSAVRHVQLHHGSAATEAPRGQRAVVASDYASLPAILLSPQSMTRVTDTDLGEKQIEVRGMINGELHIATFAAWTKRRTLTLKTLSIRKRRRKGRGAAPRPRP